MPHAFVTGSTGFVGLNLVRELVDRGWRVTALHRPESDLTWISRFPVERAVGSIADPASTLATMPGDLDAVFHVAGDTNMWSRRNPRQNRVNVEGTRHVVAAAVERRARRFVHTSSIAAYGIHEGVIDETTPQTSVRSWINYLRTKGLAEVEVRRGIERGLDAVIVNPSNIVGEFDFRGWSTAIWLADAGRLPGAPPGRGSFCHAREVARAHVAAAERGRTGANYLLGGADATYLQFIQRVCEIVGRTPPSRAMPRWVLRLVARLQAARAAFGGRRPKLTREMVELSSTNMVCRSDRAIRELEFRPVPLRTMIEDAYAWMGRAGRLGSGRGA